MYGGSGDCDDDDECQDGLKCGTNNCPDKPGFTPGDDCCQKGDTQDVKGKY